MILTHILEIDIVGGIFRTRFVIDRQWFDPPLSYRNLDKDYRVNVFFYYFFIFFIYFLGEPDQS